MAWPTLTDAYLITLVRKLIREPNARMFSDAEITRYINQGLFHLVEHTNCYMGTATKALIADTYEYSASDMGLEDCAGVRAVLFLDGSSDTVPGSDAKALSKMSPQHFSNIRASTAGDAQEYLWTQDYMYFWPLPSGTDKVMVLYYKSIIGFDANEFQSIPIQFGQFLEWYAYASCLRKQRKYAQSEQYFSYFWNFANYFREDVAEQLARVDDNGTIGKLPDRTQYVGEGQVS